VKTSPPLITHLIYRLDFGGLETLLVDMINRMPAKKYRHAIICLTDYSTFANKITQPGVEIYSLYKKPGLGLGTHIKLWKLLRRLKPAILHTYNLATIEYAFTATLAGIPVRIHAEHGRDAGDPQGKNLKHNLLRKFMVPFVDRFIPVSADLHQWLKNVVGIPDTKNTLIHNGVDTEIFSPDKNLLASTKHPFTRDCFVIGTVGRIQDVKNQSGLIDAFILLQKTLPTAKVRLAIVGDGPLLPALKNKVAAFGLEEYVWLPGARADIAEIIRDFDVFVLPSIAEGTPVTILEAMASGLPVVATRVGGIPEVVKHNRTGVLVPPADTRALTSAMANYYQHPELLIAHGTEGRDYVVRKNSMEAMLESYTQLYDELYANKITNKGLL